jgi:Acetyltransferase (GNAT) domain
MENTKEYSIKRLDASMLGDLGDLHTIVYGSRPAPQHFPKKYDTAYTGVSYVGYMAYHSDGEPLAYYGVLPCFIQWRGGIVLAAQSADTMTNPKYRYKGLFVELSLITFELCKTLGIKFVFGFPNQNSYHGAVNKLGWRMTHTMERFYVPVDSLPLELTASRFGWLKLLYGRYVDRVFGPHTLAQPGLGNAFLDEGFGGIWRDERYQLYRGYSPSRVIQAGAARVWIRVRGGLVVGDLQVGEACFAGTLEVLRDLARRAGLAGISFIVSPGTAVHRLFAAEYTSEPSFPVLFQDLGSSIPLEEIRFSYSDIDIF